MSKIDNPENSTAIKSFKFHGNGTTLFRIYFFNLILIILTLGLYYFWAKIKEKKYLYSQLEFEGDRFSFHGTGRELLIGGVFVIILLIIYSCIDLILQNYPENNFAALMSFLLGVLFLIFILIAIVVLIPGWD